MLGAVYRKPCKKASPRAFLLLLRAVAVSGIAPTALAEEALFVDATLSSGISFTHTCGSSEKDWILEVNGSGVALFDFDGDGDLDVYFANGSRLEVDQGAARPRDALFRNDGGWKFRDVTVESGLGDEGWTTGVAVADADNDGLLDLYLANWGPNALYRNRGGSFERVQDSGAEDSRWSTSASFADFDRDGLVDLYVANYVELRLDPAKRRGSAACVYKGVPVFCGPGGLEPAPDTLYRNLGSCRFRDVSEEWGLRKAPASFGLGTLVVDIERDGWPDFIVANDTRPNFCWLNQGGERFVEAGVYLGLAYNDYGVAQASMGLASGDVRGLGRDDVFVTNYEDDTNTLYLASDNGLYREGTFPAGLGSASYPFLGWGTFFFDADGDGDLDLFVANGHVAPQMDGVRSSAGYRQRNQLFLNDGSGKFSEHRDSGVFSERSALSSRGAACGDLDGDGDPDVVVNNIDAQPTLLENRCPQSRESWVVVRLRGTRSNRAAIGARVKLLAGGRWQERTLQSGMSFASQCELAARFGLGSARRAEEIIVEWPFGLRERFLPLAGGSTVVVVEGQGEKQGPIERTKDS
jgi:hypothetical protein